MGRSSRRRNWKKIRFVLAGNGPMILSEIADASRLHLEAVSYAVREMVKEGSVIELEERRPTRSGPAKLYDVRRIAMREYATNWAAKIRRNERAERVGHVIQRWAFWVKRGMPDVDPADRDRMLYQAIESAVKSMPVIQSYAVTHAHSLSGWPFRTEDPEDAYREALVRLRRRLDPVFAIAGLEGGQSTTGDRHEEWQIGKRQGGRPEAALLRQ